MSIRIAFRRGFASALSLCLGACSPLPPLTSGTELSISVAPRPAPLREVRVDTTGASETTADGVAEGAAMGTAGVLGASAGAAASVACGLLFVVCAPIFMAVGGLAGAGGVGAAAMASRPPQTDRVTDPLKLLASRIEAFGSANEVDEQLRVALVNKASPHWRIVPASSQNSMTVHVTGFALRAESAERISLEMRAMVRVNSEDMFQVPLRANDGPQVGDEGKRTSGPAVISASFFHEGAAADISQWMDESGEFLKTEVARAYEAIAQQIVNTLAGRIVG